MPMDIERIKRRIRGLLNLATDDAAADGEIVNAMTAAQAMLDEHQLDQADILAESASNDAPIPEPTYGTADAPGLGKHHITWEGTLARAISDLVGSVQVYREPARSRSVGPFGKPEIRTAYVYYGPDEDCRLAAELHAEWVTVITTMAVGKYGSFRRGDGAMYAQGFTRALHAQASIAARKRRNMVTRSTLLLTAGPSGNNEASLAKATAENSLSAVLDKQRRDASTWLKREKDVHLSAGRRSSGYRTGSHDAYASGQDDGSRADFSAKRQSKLTSGDNP